MMIITLESPEMWILVWMCGVRKGEFTASDISAICQDVSGDVCHRAIKNMINKKMIYECRDETIYLKSRRRRGLFQNKRLNEIVFKGGVFEDSFILFKNNKYVTKESFSAEMKRCGSLSPKDTRAWCWPSDYILSALHAAGKIDLFIKRTDSSYKFLYCLANKDAPFIIKSKQKNRIVSWYHKIFRIKS